MYAFSGLGDVQRLTGDYRAAAATVDQAQALSRDPRRPLMVGLVLNQLGVLHRLTGDYPAAASPPPIYTTWAESGSPVCLVLHSCICRATVMRLARARARSSWSCACVYPAGG
jgi:hypothetical protein